MRHLHFTQSLETLQGGGLGSSTVALHRQMGALGLSSTLCSTHGGQPRYPDDGIFEFRRQGPSFIYYSSALRREAGRFVEGADVVHGHGFYTGVNMVFGRETRRRRKPLVYHAHGMLEPYILSRSRWKKNLVHWLFENDNFRQARLLRALTSTEADQIRAAGLTQPIVVVPNGVDLSYFSQTSPAPAALATPWIPRLEKTRLRMLFLGRIHPKKGLDIFLGSLAAVPQWRDAWEVVIAGPDEGGYLAQVRQLVGQLGLETCVHFTGPVSGALKIHLLHSADLFVLPSYSEGFPVSLLEAAACAVPALATRTCNFSEITRFEAGWECDPTLESLTGALKNALGADETERRQRGQNGRSLVEKHFDWPSIIGRLTHACEGVA